MRFRRKKQAERRESIVPMINVVFLLLIFLLITAEMAPPTPLDVAPPEATPEAPPPGETVLHVDADGTVALGALRDDQALAAIPPGAQVYIRADAQLPAAELAALLPHLAHAGEVRLVTVTP